MLTKKSLASQANFKNSMELGAVIEESEKPLDDLELVVGGWLFGGALIGGLLSLELGWSGFFFSIGFWALAAVVMVAQRVRGKITNRTLRVHENGLCCVQGDASTEIRYHQLDEYCYKKTMICNESFCLRKDFELEMKADTLGDPKTIKWNDFALRARQGNQQNSIDFDALHFRISKRVAGNMAAKLEADGKIAWGKSSYIRQDGIEASVKTGMLSSEMRFIPWSELKDMTFHEGKLLLSLESGNGSVEIPCDEPNLFPGFLLINRLMKTLYGNRMVNRQTDEEMAIALAERSIYPNNGSP